MSGRVATARPGAYAKARVRDLDRALVRALNRARALDYQLPRNRVRELTLALAGDLRQIRMLAVEFEVEFDGGGEFIRGLAHERDFALMDDFHHGGHLARARELARRLAGDLEEFRSLSDQLAEARERADARPGHGRRQAGTPVCTGPDPVVARAAAGLVAHAVRVLPAADRARWREEFDAELEELAGAEASRRAQLGHAARVAGRVWSLRRALQARSPALR